MTEKFICAELPSATDPLWQQAFPILQQLRPHLVFETVAACYEAPATQRPTFTVLKDENDAVLAVATWRIMANTNSGKILFVDDLVTAEQNRSQGVGKAILSYLKEQARQHGCSKLELDSGTPRTKAHKFYLREDLVIASFHFVTEV